jgi:epoxyqueuosine reductase
VPSGEHWTIDARRCIAYLNIELRGSIPEEHRASMGAHVFGCDVCQEVCPWNSRAPETGDPAFEPEHEPGPALETLAYLSEPEFRARFRNSPVTRPKYDGFLRNVAVAMGATGLERFHEPLEHLTRHPSAVVAEHARWALSELEKCAPQPRH